MPMARAVTVAAIVATINGNTTSVSAVISKSRNIAMIGACVVAATAAPMPTTA